MLVLPFLFIEKIISVVAFFFSPSLTGLNCQAYKLQRIFPREIVIMAIKGEGPWVTGAMWSLTAVAFIFVVLRAYTRIFVVKSFGVDDHVYNLAFVSCATLYRPEVC